MIFRGGIQTGGGGSGSAHDEVVSSSQLNRINMHICIIRPSSSAYVHILSNLSHDVYESDIMSDYEQKMPQSQTKDMHREEETEIRR